MIQLTLAWLFFVGYALAITPVMRDCGYALLLTAATLKLLLELQYLFV